MSDPSAGSPPAVSTNVRASSFASRYAYPSCIWVQTSVIVCHKGWNLPVSEPGSVPCHPMRSNANFFLYFSASTKVEYTSNLTQFLVGLCALDPKVRARVTCVLCVYLTPLVPQSLSYMHGRVHAALWGLSRLP